MKTLNKTLSLVLVLVMVLGLFGVASAADFKDKAEIENVEAVNTMAALNIINGKNGNVFDPTGTVTRAEMSKMICVALNGGKEPVLGTTANPTYSDIQGHWAAGYIEFCSTLGIVAGMGDGTFAPDATVTGSQAAKMMLVAMNYKADVFGFTGPAWETRVNVEANKAGLYADLGGLNASEALSRDNAAQLIYNGIFGGMMVLSWQQNANGEITQNYSLDTDKTIATEKFGLEIGYGTITNVIYNSVTKKYDHTVVPDATPGVAPAPAAFSTEAEYSSLLEMYTKVLYKPNSDGTVTVYGAYPVRSSVIFAGVIGQLSEATFNNTGIADATEFTLNGTTYKADSTLTLAGLPVYDFNAGIRAAATDTIGEYYTAANNPATAYLASYSFKAIDITGDNRIDKVIVYPFTVEKVTYVGTNIASTTAAAAFGGTAGQISLEDDVYYDGIAKNDWVKKTAAANTVSGANTYEKIMPMTGKVDRTSTTDSGMSKVQMNGIWFVDFTGAAMGLGNTYEDIAQVNTFVYFAEQKSDVVSAEQYAVLLASAQDSYEAGAYNAKLLFSDGTTKEVPVSGYTGVNNGSTNALVNFTVNSAGKYALSAAAQGTFDATLANTHNYSASTQGTIDGCAIADDAVIFVNVTSVGHKVMTGAQFKTVRNVSTVHDAYANNLGSTGFKAVKLAYVTIPANATTGSTLYGYVTENLSTVKNTNNSTVSEITFWNGTETVTQIASQDYSATLDKGDLFSYTVDANGAITVAPITGLTRAAVTAYDGTLMSVNSGVTAKKITAADTVVMYINSADKKGVAGGEIRLADAVNHVLVPNVYYVHSGVATDPYTLVVFDVNNNMAETPNASAYAAASLVVAQGTTNGVGGVTGAVSTNNVAITGWVTATNDTIKVTYTAAAGQRADVTVTQGANTDTANATGAAATVDDFALADTTTPIVITVKLTEAGKDANFIQYTIPASSIS